MVKNDKIKILFTVLIISFTVIGLFLPKDSRETKCNIFPINKGENVFVISKRLEQEKMIESSFLFNLYIFASGNHPNLRVGQYCLSQNMNIIEISKKIIQGKTMKEMITIPEGWNLRDISKFFESKGLFQSEEVLKETGFPAINYSVVKNFPKPKNFQEYRVLQDKPQNLSLEGYLFPDTYKLEKGFSIDDFIRKALNNINQKIDQNLRQEIQKQNKTIFEIITMASMLEKEARSVNDKKIISGILWKRLDNNMPLQIDATVLYFTGKTINNLSKEDFKIDSPYNTYTNKGLPLGPICNPGIESILSAIYPQKTDYWYYLSTPQGKVIFSKTLQEHNINKLKYLSK